MLRTTQVADGRASLLSYCPVTFANRVSGTEILHPLVMSPGNWCVGGWGGRGGLQWSPTPPHTQTSVSPSCRIFCQPNAEIFLPLPSPEAGRPPSLPQAPSAPLLMSPHALCRLAVGLGAKEGRGEPAPDSKFSTDSLWEVRRTFLTYCSFERNSVRQADPCVGEDRTCGKRQRQRQVGREAGGSSAPARKEKRGFSLWERAPPWWCSPESRPLEVSKREP